MKAIFVMLLPALPLFAPAQEPTRYLSAQQIFDRVIHHYDPGDRWPTFYGEMHLYTLQPEGRSTEEDLVYDKANDVYQSTLFYDNHIITRGIRNGASFFTVDGREVVSEKEEVEYGLNEEALQWVVPHHRLHFGLPMYLREIGIDPDPQWKRESFGGIECLVLRFAGADKGGAYFADPLLLYVNPEDYSLKGVRYLNTHRPYPSCYAVFNEEITVGGIQVPKVKTYFREQDGSYFFTDSFFPFTRLVYEDRTAEEAAIRQVLEEETRCFYVRDYNKWASYWSHQADVFFSHTSKDGYTIRKGWEEVSEHIRNYMRENPDPHQPPIERSHYVFHLQGNLAWVYFDNQEGDQRGRHQRVLRKENGQWKLINMTGINESSYEN